ncbi:MAG: DUF302 domain-containing protein [Proteobacteria bacterium]|nr:DUF302 domain-containing protein [Pseudomonadota bacterium]
MATAFASMGCKGNPPGTVPSATEPHRLGGQNGLVAVSSQYTVGDAKARLQQAIAANDKLSTIAEIDHASNAAGVGLQLDPTEVILFGNPALGTPLMQVNQKTGIDLPQKMLFAADSRGTTVVMYNDPEYLRQRHGLDEAASQLATMTRAMSGLAHKSSGHAVAPGDSGISPQQGLIVTKSAHSVDETYRRLEAAIEGAGPLRVLARLDHRANAQTVGLTLRPTRLLVFGNPALGTRLMQKKQSIGLDLPQKFLVYEDGAGDVFIVHNDPHYLAARHGITDGGDILATIANALNKLAAAASSTGSAL